MLTPPKEIEEAWREEIQRRHQARLDGTAKSIPLEEVIADIQKRFDKNGSAYHRPGRSQR